MRAHNKIELPKDFAQRLLDNEIQFKLADKPSSDVLCNLIELYSTGLSYFQSIKSYKYLYFKKKMDEIFLQEAKLFKDTKAQQKEAQTEGESPISKKLKSKNEQERIEALKIKQKQEKMENEVIQRTKTQQTKKQAEKIIKNVVQKDRMIENKIKNTLAKQDQLLEQKLMERKKKSFSKSFSAFGLTQGTETKESLFLQQPQKKNINDKVAIEPLIVNFQNVINDDDSQDEKDIVILNKTAIIPRGRMASMGRLK